MESPLLDRPKSLLEHLNDLRSTLVGCVLSLVVGMGIVCYWVPQLFAWLCRPLNAVTDDPGQFLRSLTLTGGFSIYLQILFWCGLIVSMPAMLFFIGRFVLPALTLKERKAVLGAFFAAVGLFAGGVALCYALVLPVTLKIMLALHTEMGIRAEWTVTSYVGFTVPFMLAFGLVFELPLIMMVLGWLGIVSSALLRAYRRHAIVAVLVLAAVLTPGPDIFSQLVMGVPLIVLYEACIWSIWLMERSRRRQADAL